MHSALVSNIADANASSSALLSRPDDLPHSSLPKRADIDTTVRHVTWGEQVEEEESDVPALGEEEPEQEAPEELYDDWFWEAPDGETESESENDHRHEIILEPNERNTRGTTNEAILLKWHRLLGHINPYFLM